MHAHVPAPTLCRQKDGDACYCEVLTKSNSSNRPSDDTYTSTTATHRNSANPGTSSVSITRTTRRMQMDWPVSSASSSTSSSSLALALSHLWVLLSVYILRTLCNLLHSQCVRRSRPRLQSRCDGRHLIEGGVMRNFPVSR